ncbi:MAG: nucleotidyltransferase [Bdellovibrionales bacterium]|nr:nucleotidyltransferase [Bdellovibrionales bacterium]
MKIDFKTCNEEQLWKYVGRHLSKNGIDAVLVGGAVVSIYTKGAYESGDLDFVVQNLMKDTIPAIMSEIGFKRKGRHFVHPECKHLYVEFPSGPLGIGEDINIEPDEHKGKGSVLKILSPTDCIKDRLASYIYFKSNEGLDQAVLVATEQPFKKEAVKKWCLNEGAEWAFKDFLDKVKGSRKKK